MFRKLSASMLSLSMALFGSPLPVLGTEGTSTESPDIITDVISGTVGEIEATIEASNEITPEQLAATQTGPQEPAPDANGVPPDGGEGAPPEDNEEGDRLSQVALALLAMGQELGTSLLDMLIALSGNEQVEQYAPIEIYAPMERIHNSLLDFVRTGNGGAELLRPLRAYQVFLNERFQQVEQAIQARIEAGQPLSARQAHLMKARSQLRAIIEGVELLLRKGDPTIPAIWGSYNPDPLLDPDGDVIGGTSGYRPDFIRPEDRINARPPRRVLDTHPDHRGDTVFRRITTLLTRAADGNGPPLTVDQGTVLRMMRGVAGFDFNVFVVRIARRTALQKLKALLQQLRAAAPPPPEEGPVSAAAPIAEPIPLAPVETVPPADPVAQDGKTGDGLVPVSLTEAQPEVGGAALDADLDRIRDLLNNVGTVDPNAPAFPGVNSTEAHVANNYLNALWGLMEHIARLVENPGWATQAQKDRMRDMFEAQFLAMLRRATNPPLGNPVDIATGKVGLMFTVYIRSGLATPSRALTLYREMRTNQDRFITRMRTVAAGATAAADFTTPYGNTTALFNGYLGGTAAMLNVSEAHLIPFLSQGMALTADQRRQAREEIRANATARMTNMIDICERAQALGIRTSTFLGVGLDDGLYKTWTDVMRAVANLVTEGEEATAPARAVYTSVAAVVPRMRGLVALLYPLDNSDGLRTARVVLEEMPMEIMPLLTEAQQTALLQEYRSVFQVLRSRIIAIASNAGLTHAGNISGVVDAVDTAVTAMKNLVGTTMTPAEWQTIYTEIGHCLRIAADRVSGMEANFLRQSSVESLAQSTGAFASALVQMLDQPPFAGLPRDPLQGVTTLILGLFPPILTRLQGIAPCPNSSDNAEAMAQLIQENAQCGYEFLQDYIRRRLEEAPP